MFSSGTGALKIFGVTKEIKNNPILRWGLSDRVFFAVGACHILAYAFLERYPNSNYNPLWIKPKPGFVGNHIILVNEEGAFDYHGYSNRQKLLDHFKLKANRHTSGWDYSTFTLPVDVLVSEKKSREYEGLWLREPKQFLYDALPRAHSFLDRFPAP